MTDAHPPKPGLSFAVGVIGHRPNRLPEGADKWLDGQIRAVLAAIHDAALTAAQTHARFFSKEPACLRVVSALAEGSDRIGAHLGLAQGFALSAPLPFASKDYERDFTAPESKAEFHALMAKAASILELPGDRHEEDKAYERAGMAVLDASDLLIAVWDGKPSAGRGGTTETVHEAARRGMPVIWVNPAVGEETRIFWQEGIANHPGPAYFDKPFSTDLLSGAAIAVDRLLRPPKSTSEQRGMHHYLHQHARRWNFNFAFPVLLFLGGRKLRVSDFVRKPLSVLAGEQAPLQTAPQLLLHSYVWADEIAIYFAQLFRSAFIRNFLLAAFATIFVVMALPPPWSGVEIVLVLILIFNTLLGRRRGWHHLWIEAREIAERLRAAVPLQAAGSRLTPSYGEASNWTGWYVRALLRQAGLRHAVLNDDALGAMWKSLHGLLEDQKTYHSATARRFKALHHRLSDLGTLLFSLALAISAIVFVIEWRELAHIPDGLHHWIIVITAGLPALAAASYGIRVIGDFDGAAARSARMASELGALLRGAGKNTPSIDGLREISRRAAEVMLGDVASWRLAAESRELDMPG
jgi:hypothetical protein